MSINKFFLFFSIFYILHISVIFTSSGKDEKNNPKIKYNKDQFIIFFTDLNLEIKKLGIDKEVIRVIESRQQEQLNSFEDGEEKDLFRIFFLVFHPDKFAKWFNDQQAKKEKYSQEFKKLVEVINKSYFLQTDSKSYSNSHWFTEREKEFMKQEIFFKEYLNGLTKEEREKKNESEHRNIFERIQESFIIVKEPISETLKKHMVEIYNKQKNKINNSVITEKNEVAVFIKLDHFSYINIVVHELITNLQDKLRVLKNYNEEIDLSYIVSNIELECIDKKNEKYFKEILVFLYGEEEYAEFEKNIKDKNSLLYNKYYKNKLELFLLRYNKFLYGHVLYFNKKFISELIDKKRENSLKKIDEELKKFQDGYYKYVEYVRSGIASAYCRWTDDFKNTKIGDFRVIFDKLFCISLILF